MLRHCSFAVSCVVIGASFAPVQEQLPRKPQRASEELRHGGTYHVASGTLTAPDDPAGTNLFGPPVLYDNTCFTGYYASLFLGGRLFDSGRVPSTSSPAGGSSLTGTQDSYLVDGFRIAYCTADARPFQTAIEIFPCWAPCDDPTSLTPIATIPVTGPGALADGTLACWILDVDLTGGQEVTLPADCNGVFDNLGSLDNFGWSFRMLEQPINGTAGPVIAGGPTSCAFGDGTVFAPGSGPDGTGLGQTDNYWHEDFATTTSGCFFFGGNPWAGFYFELHGDAGTSPCNATAAPAVPIPLGPDPYRGVLGDVNDDGAPDLVVAHRGAALVPIFVALGDGAGGFLAPAGVFVSAITLGGLALGDVDGDGDLDIVFSTVDTLDCAGNNAVRVLHNNGFGGFTLSPAIFATGPHPRDLVLVDLNDDGALDVVTANAGVSSCGNQGLSVLLGNGLGGFSPAQHTALGTGIDRLAVGRIDANGTLDLVATDSTGGGFVVLLGDGLGGFFIGQTQPGFQIFDVALADVDEDGDVDAFLPFPVLGLVLVVWNDGLGNFPLAEGIGVIGVFIAIAVADLDLDGRVDFVTANGGSADLTVLRGISGPNFAPCLTIPVTTPPEWIELADLDFDGDQDLLVDAFGIDQVATLLSEIDPAQVYGGVFLPNGAVSFADQVLLADPTQGGGPAPSAPYDDPLAALGVPDAFRFPGSRTCSLGHGGVLELGFVDNNLANSGDPAHDLALFFAALPAELVDVALHPADAATRTRLETFLGTVLDPADYVALGSLGSYTTTIDIDAVFTGFAASELRFDAVRLSDDATDGAAAGHSVGADIDAAAAITTTVSVIDLVARNLVVPAQGLTGDPFQVSFEILNQGDAPTTSTWADSVWASTDTVFGNADDILLGVFNSVVALGPGEFYPQVEQLTYPATPGSYWIVVETDSGSVVPEGAFENNNETFSAAPIDVQQAPRPDLVAQSIVVPQQGIAEQAFQMSWQVLNQGQLPTAGGWTDVVVASTDTVFGNGDDLLLGSFPSVAALGVGQSYTRNAQLEYPSAPASWWIFVKADSADAIDEGSSEGNNEALSSAPIDVLPLPRPDLIAELLQVPAGPVDSGTQVTLTYRITNIGTGATAAPSWQDQVFLLEQPSDPLTSSNRVASALNPTALSPGLAYQRTVGFTLPTDFSGDRWLAVKADGSGQVAELDETNNTVVAAMAFTVELEDQPDLVAADVRYGSAPPVIAFSGQSLTVFWEDRNDGLGLPDVGSWVDRVYLSTDNSATILPGDLLLAQPTIAGGFLGSGQDVTNTTQILLPTNASGLHWVKVQVDAVGQVSELGFEANNVSVSANPVDVVLGLTPDLHALSVERVGSGQILAGHAITVEWSVVDEGFADWAFGFSWVDRVYLSSDTQLDAGDVLLTPSLGQGAFFDGSQWVGSTYTKSTSVTIPQGTAVGQWFLIASIDANNSVFEFVSDGGMPPVNVGEDDNVTVSSALSIDLLATDLVISPGTISSPVRTTGIAGASIPLAWEVTNQGAAVTPATTWFDAVYLSIDTTLGGGDIVVAQANHNGALGSGANYVASATGTLPFVAPGSYNLLFVVDVADVVWELGGEGNNVVASPFTIGADAADLAVQSLAAPKTIGAGEPLVLAWTAQNVGNRPTSSSSWNDRVWLSPDASIGPGDVSLGSLTHGGTLAGGALYDALGSFTVPESVSGLWYVMLELDSNAHVFEADETNNTAFSRMQIDVSAYVPANLVVEAVSAPTQALSGQPLSVDWTVRNVGSGATNRADWLDQVYLSLNQLFDGSDVPIGAFQHPGFLGVGEQRMVTHSNLVQLGLAGSYFVIVRTDTQNRVIEDDDTDNSASSPLLVQIALPPPADLRITDVTIPTSATLGELASLSWTTTNDQGSTVNGQWEDTFFLSSDTVLDATDTLLTELVNLAGSLPVGGSHVQVANVEVPGVLPGSYHVLVQSDARSQIPEIDEDDNGFASVGQIALSALPLAAGASLAHELDNGRSAYYELSAPAGETVRLTLTHDSASAWTELYAREGAIPAPGLADLTSSEPGISAQTVTIPVTSGQQWYVLARATTGVAPLTRDATLASEIVPFEISSVTPDRAGTGLVTLELGGSRLLSLVSATLRRNGTSELVGHSELVIVSAVRALAVFDLSGATTGTWDVLIDGGAEGTSELLAALTVEPAVNRTLGLVCQVAPSVRKGSSGEGILRAENRGNVNVQHAALVLGRASSADVQVGSAELGQATLESDGATDSLVLLAEDLGPGQSVEVGFEFDVDGLSPADELVLALAGAPFGSSAFDARMLADTAEALRQAVLADPQSSSALLAQASTQPGWLGAITASLPPDATDVHLPGTPPATGRGFVETLAAAAGAGLSQVDQVPNGAVETTVASLFCLPFAGSAFDCAGLAPLDPGTAYELADVDSVEGVLAPIGRAVCATPTSNDPNEKSGPPGFGDQNMVSGSGSMTYRIYFENAPTAAAPAAHVEIRDPLEPGLRLAAFRPVAVSFGETLVQLPGNSPSYRGTIAVAETLGVNVELTVGVNAQTREAFWIFQSIDPVTGEPVADGIRGFLPPNGVDGEGEGYVEFLTGPAPEVGSGAVVRNRGTIIFDENQSIGTDETSNTVDGEAPTSTMQPVTPLAATFDVQLAWNGSDPLGGSGLASYTIWASRDGAPFNPVVTNTTETSTVFSGIQGSTYAFYSIARDNTGNAEAPPPTPDAVVTIPFDCNTNGVPDDVDIAMGTSEDCDSSGVPDECELDCNGNGLHDSCDIAAGTSLDCNGNGVPDDCDIASGTSPDADSNGVPDECECRVESACVTSPNSVGPGAVMSLIGTPSVSANDVVLRVTGCNRFQRGIFFYGPEQAPAPLFQGQICVASGPQLCRIGFVITDDAGSAQRVFDLSVPPASSGPCRIDPGSTWIFQFFYRDPQGPNLSDSLRVTFCQ